MTLENRFMEIRLLRFSFALQIDCPVLYTALYFRPPYITGVSVTRRHRHRHCAIQFHNPLPPRPLAAALRHTLVSPCLRHSPTRLNLMTLT